MKEGGESKKFMISPFKRKPDENESGYEPEIESNEESEQESKAKYRGDIARMTMEEYNRRM